jgi:hypothetical protein
VCCAKKVDNEKRRGGDCAVKRLRCVILKYCLCVLCMCVDMVGVRGCVEHVLSMFAKRPEWGVWYKCFEEGCACALMRWGVLYCKEVWGVSCGEVGWGCELHVERW